MTDTHQPWNPPPTESGRPPAPDPYGPMFGPLGQVRSTGTCILLFFLTLGLYGLVWFYKSHDEMYRHTNQAFGPFDLFIVFVLPYTLPFVTSNEVGKLYGNRGAPPPVSGITGLWYVPGFLLLLIGPFVWFIKTNNALNEYWMRSAQSQPA